MSNVEAPNVNADGEITNQELLSEQSGMPNMSSTKTFTVDTNMQVNGDLDVTGTVTATSFVGDGSQLTGISGGTGGGLDSADVTLLVDSDYVQARETPQDFAYSSLTGAPTALSSFTNDTSYITAADIPATVDSDYVAARAPAGGGLDSAAVISLTGTEVQTSAGGIDYSAQSRLRVEDGAIGLSTIDADTGAESLTYSGTTWQLAGNPVGASSQRITHHLWSTSYSNASLTASNDVYVGTRYAGTKFSYPSMKSYVPTAAQFGGGFEWDHAGTTVLDLSTDGAVFSSSVTATSFVGDGSGLTNLPSGGGLDSAATIALIGMQNNPAGNNAIQITPDTSTLNGDNNNIIIGTQISDMAGIGPQAVAMGYDIGAQANGVSIGYQAGAGSQSTNTGGVFIGSRTNYFGNSNPADYAIAIGHEAGAVYPGVGSIALGADAGKGSSGDYTVAIGYKANTTSTFDNTIIIKADGSAAHNSTAQYDIDIRTSAAGSLTYNTTNDWTFGAGVTMTDLTASGATVVFSNLPTTDPVNAGQLWNDAGTLKISAG